MVAPVVVGLSRVVVGFAKSPAGKQFLKRLKDAGKSPAERKALLTEQVQKSFRDSPGIRQRLIALEKGEIEELSKAEILAKKIAERKAGKKERWDFAQKTGHVKPEDRKIHDWDAFKGSGYIHEPVSTPGIVGPTPRQFGLTAKGKKDLQRAIDSGDVNQLTKRQQAAVAKLIDKGELKGNPAFAYQSLPERTSAAQLDMFPDEALGVEATKTIKSIKRRPIKKAPVSNTKVGMLQKRIRDANEDIEKLKARGLGEGDDQLRKAYAKLDRLENELTASRGQKSLFGVKAEDEFSEASAIASAKRNLERDRLKRKRMEEAWTREKELKDIEENAAAIRADIQRDPRRLPKDIHKKPYNPQEYGFEGYNPGWKGEPVVGGERIYRGSGKAIERKGYVTPKAHETMSGTGRTELPEYTLEAPKPYGVPKIPGARGAAPAFAKELTGRQTRRSMGAITPEDDILAGVPYSLNPQGKLKFAYPKTGDIKTSTVTKTREWDSVSGKMKDIPKKIRASKEKATELRIKGYRDLTKEEIDTNAIIKNPEYGVKEVAWAGRTGAPRDRVSSQTGLTIDEFASLSNAQKNELNRRLQLAKAGGARISEPATGFKIPPELTQTGMTQAEYAGLAGARSRGMMWGEQRGALDRAQGRILERTTPDAAGRHAKTRRKTILEDEFTTLDDKTKMTTADFRKLPPMERLGMLDKNFVAASPKGQGFKNLTKQQERLAEIKKPKEWWDTGAPNKPMDYTKSYRGETKGQAIRKAKQAREEFKKIALEFSPEEYAKLKPTEIESIRSFIRFHPEGVKQGAKALSEDISELAGHMSKSNAIKLLIKTGHLKVHPKKIAPFKKGGSVDKNWIQKVRSRIEKKGTEGVCTGEKYGSSSCPPGSKRYNLATTFRNMNRKRA